MLCCFKNTVLQVSRLTAVCKNVCTDNDAQYNSIVHLHVAQVNVYLKNIQAKLYMHADCRIKCAMAENRLLLGNKISMWTVLPQLVSISGLVKAKQKSCASVEIKINK